MTNRNVHVKIKELRESKGLSQEELSEKAGISLRTIQRMENGESIPRGSTLKNIASSLDVSLDYFNTIPEEINDSTLTEQTKLERKRIRIPWYIIGYTIIGLSSGFIVGLVMILSELIPDNDIGALIACSVSILFGAIGLVFGNYIEKKNNNSLQ